MKKLSHSFINLFIIITIQLINSTLQQNHSTNQNSSLASSQQQQQQPNQDQINHLPISIDQINSNLNQSIHSIDQNLNHSSNLKSNISNLDSISSSNNNLNNKHLNNNLNNNTQNDNLNNNLNNTLNLSPKPDTNQTTPHSHPTITPQNHSNLDNITFLDLASFNSTPSLNNTILFQKKPNNSSHSNVVTDQIENINSSKNLPTHSNLQNSTLPFDNNQTDNTFTSLPFHLNSSSNPKPSPLIIFDHPNNSTPIQTVDQINSTLASPPFQFKPINNSNHLTPIGEINSTLISNPFNYTPLHNANSSATGIGNINSTLVSNPFKYLSPQNHTTNSTHFNGFNSTLVSNPFKYLSPNTTSTPLPHSNPNLNSTLDLSHFGHASQNASIISLAPSIGDLNSTLPFNYSSPNKSSSDLFHFGQINSSLISSPFKYNPSNNNTTHTRPIQIDDLNSTLVSNPFKSNSSTLNDTNPLHTGDINSTLISNPLRYTSHNNSVVNPIHLINDLNSTLTSNPFKLNPSNNTILSPADINSTLISNPFNPDLSNATQNITTLPFASNSSLNTLPPSLSDHSNLTLVSPLFHLNSSNATTSNLLDSLPDKNSTRTLTFPSNITNVTTTTTTTTINEPNVFLLPSTNKSLNTNVTLLANSNSSLSTGLISDNITSLNNSSISQTPYHRNDTKPAPAFVPTGSLFTNPRPSDSKAKSKPSNPVETSLPSTQAPPNKAAPAPFPSSWPRYIVPSNTPTSPPANSTLISILFTDALNWPWMVTNSNASSQVLVFMPTLIAYSLEISEDQVVTQSLQAYQPANFNSNDEASMLTLWLGYIPSQYVAELQSLIRAPQSRFYSNPNLVLRTLAKTVDPTLSITTYEKKTPASQAGASVNNTQDENPPAVNSGQKIAVIASVTTCGAAILAIGLAIAARQSRRRVAIAHRREALESNNGSSSGLRIGAPMIGSFQRGADGAPIAINRPNMEQVSAVPFNGNAHPRNDNLESSPTNSQNRSPVRYEYGEARTTSMIHDPFQTANDQRKSWWNRLSFGVTGGNTSNRNESNGYGPLWENNQPCHLDSHADSNHPHQPTAQAINSQSSSPPRNNRRLPITRGADGLVSGIGRPVMKENSLFF